MTARILADAFRVTESTIYRWSDDGLIPSVRIGGSVRFVPTDVADALAAAAINENEATK